MPSPFSEAVWEHFHRPRRAGSLAAPSGEGFAGSPERGPYMRIQVLLEGGLLSDLRFATYGCVPAIACGSYVSEWAPGRPVEEAMALDPDDVVAALGGLPQDRVFCAGLAVEALRAAISDAVEKVKEARA